ncbi:MAG: sulfotransferase family protein [Aquaticitalea sp.]
MDNQTQPFFILGNPRSGTTLLRLMLDAHPDITVPPECGFIVWFFDTYKNVDFSENPIEKIDSFVESLKTAKKIESWSLDFEHLKKYLQSQNFSNYSEIVNGVYEFYAISHQKQIQFWGDKNNYYLNHIPTLRMIFPNAKFIHIIRDGRDVACSYKELNSKNIDSEYAPKLANDISEISKEWQSNNHKIVNDLESLIKPENSCAIRYEDLVVDSKNELKRICKFLEIDFNLTMLEYHKISKTYEPKEYLQWKSNTKKSPQSDSINRYLKDLTKLEINAFNSHAHQMLTKFDYEL